MIERHHPEPLRLERVAAPLPVPRPIVIKDARHGHTAAMRLANAANLILSEHDLRPEYRDYISARLKQIADEIQKGE